MTLAHAGGGQEVDTEHAPRSRIKHLSEEVLNGGLEAANLRGELQLSRDECLQLEKLD